MAPPVTACPHHSVERGYAPGPQPSGAGLAVGQAGPADALATGGLPAPAAPAAGGRGRGRGGGAPDRDGEGTQETGIAYVANQPAGGRVRVGKLVSGWTGIQYACPISVARRVSI